ncbi:MAG TPA: hypothetical protein VNU68_25875 [Verrucomicrobiae bacterium]|nr:hypothetical protein [Verrucomicrobiae bacterium]
MSAFTFKTTEAGLKAILIGGPIALGMLIVLVVSMAWPELRAANDLLFAFAAGTALGLSVCAPIASAIVFRARLRRWLTQHGSVLQRCASVLMAFALGYLIASVRQQSSDVYVALSFLVLSLAVLTKIVFAIAWHAGDAGPAPGSGGTRPPPPGPRVPRPPGGRPPVLSAAAVAKLDEG